MILINIFDGYQFEKKIHLNCPILKQYMDNRFNIICINEHIIHTTSSF